MDTFLDFRGYLVDYEDGYRLVRSPGREMNYDNGYQNAVTFELSMHKRVFRRTVFSLLDYLAEVGGLVTAISSGFTLLLSIINYWSGF